MNPRSGSYTINDFLAIPKRALRALWWSSTKVTFIWRIMTSNLPIPWYRSVAPIVLQIFLAFICHHKLPFLWKFGLGFWGLYAKKKIFQVHIDPGIASNHKFTFRGDGDQEPNKEPGDVIIQLEEKSHDIYQRHGKDMAMRMDLTLSESLCGFTRVLKSLGTEFTYYDIS